MTTKIACVHCGFIFEDEDMEVCPVCGTELGQEWDPSVLKSFVITELSGQQAELVGKLLHKKAAEISAMIISDGCVGLDELTPVQVESYATKLNNAGVKFAVETPEQKAIRVQEQLKARAAKDAARAADSSAAAAADAKARAEAEAKAKQAAAIEAEKLASAKQADAEKMAAKAAADSAAKQAQAATEAEKARLAAEENKAKLVAKAAADAAQKLELEKIKAEAEAQIKIAEAQANAAVAAERTKQMELEAIEAKKKRRSKIFKWGCGSVMFIAVLFIGLLVYAGYESEKTARIQARIDAEERERAEKRAAEEKAREEARIAAAKKAKEDAIAYESFQNTGKWKIGKTIKVPLKNGVCLDLMLCPAGDFTMGSSSYESGREKDETKHSVSLTTKFLIGKYEVTQAQYEAVMGELSPKQKEKIILDKDSPVAYISWQEAMAFCDELNEITKGKRPGSWKFTLPTEAQWEYACRAGTTTSLNSGRDMRIIGKNNAPALDKVGWYAGNCGQNFDLSESFDISDYEETQYSDKRGGPHKVGQKRPNAWGIYDMHGNVWEWCRDWYGSYDSNRSVNPSGASSGSSRVCRGGGWKSVARACRSAERAGEDPDERFNHVGFRVVLKYDGW